MMNATVENKTMKMKMLALIVTSALLLGARLTLAGIPEPGILQYGDIKDPAGNRITSGKVIWTYTPVDGGNTVTVSAPLAELIGSNGTYAYSVQVPLETAKAGSPVSSRAIPLSATPVTYKRTGTVEGTILSMSDTVQISSADRGTTKMASIIIILPPPTVSGITPTKVTTPTWSWTSGGIGGNGTFRYRLNNPTLTTGATVTTDTAFTPPAALPAGPHTLYVQEQIDADTWSASGKLRIDIDLTPPVLVSVTPTPVTTEKGLAQTFNAIYRAAEGYGNLKAVDLLVNPTSTVANGIRVQYDPAAGKLMLFNNAGTAVVSTCTPQEIGATISNSYGTLDCEKTTVTKAGNDITINWSLTPKAAFASTVDKTIFMGATDKAGNSVAWTAKGIWTILATNNSPTFGTLTLANPTSPAGTANTLTAVYNDPDGFANLNAVELLVTNGSIANAIYIRYERGSNKLFLYNDDGASLQATTCKPGSAATLSNTQGSLNCQNTSVVQTGNSITLKWRVTPGSGFVGVKDVQLKAIDNSGLMAGLTSKGSWNVTTAAVLLQARAAANRAMTNPSAVQEPIYSVITYGVSGTVPFSSITEKSLSDEAISDDIALIVEPTDQEGSGQLSVSLRKPEEPLAYDTLRGAFSMAQHATNITMLVEYLFDGKGLVTITEKRSSSGKLANSETLPYSLTPDGVVTIGQLSGQLSDDGQVLALTSGSDVKPILLVGVKGKVLPDYSMAPYLGVAIKTTLAGPTFGKSPETTSKGCVISENGNTAICLKGMNTERSSIQIMLRQK